MTAHTTFAVADVTKAFVGALAVKLAQEGRVSLNEPLSRTLPDWPYAGQITLRELLAQRSGVSTAIDGTAIAQAIDRNPRGFWSTRRVLSYARAPSFRPGASWQYTDTNYLLAGLVLEHSAHEPVAVALRHEILDPLGVRDVVLQPQQQPAPDAAHGYVLGSDQREHDLSDGTGFVPYRAAASSFWTAGGIVASAPSVAKFGDAVIDGTLLDPAARQQMTSFRTVGTPGPFSAYALGLAQLHTPELGDLWTAVGGVPGFGSTLAYLPAHHITVAVLANQSDSTLATLNIAQVLIQTVTGHH